MGIMLKEFLCVYVLRDAMRVNPTLGMRENWKYVGEAVAIAKAMAHGSELIRDLVRDGCGTHKTPRYYTDREFELYETRIKIREGTWKRIANLVAQAIYEWATDGEVAYRRLIIELATGLIAKDVDLLYRADGLDSILRSAEVLAYYMYTTWAVFERKEAEI